MLASDVSLCTNHGNVIAQTFLCLEGASVPGSCAISTRHLETLCGNGGGKELS